LANWARTARRIRVPLGFVFAVAYLWLARPTWTSLAIGAAVVVAGIALRAAASGHVRKDTELTTTGPYAYTRNPLYLGSVIIAAGFAVAALSLAVVVALALLFILVYVPVIRAEEEFLRQRFPEYDDYARRVPRMLPRLHIEAVGSEFSRALYMQHREYNAIAGSAAMLAALAAKILWRT
jgi:protein-S-isoprenylcysteine O-methyltransferase Ste14